MLLDLTDPAQALAKSLAGPVEQPGFRRLDALRRLVALCRSPPVESALRQEAGTFAEADWLVVAAETLIVDAAPALAAWEKACSAGPTVVAVVVEGGLVQAVCVSRPLPCVRFEVVDYDVEGAQAEDLSAIAFVDGTTTPAFRRVEALTTPSDIDWSRFDAGPA